jgi:hypothetical protein
MGTRQLLKWNFALFQPQRMFCFDSPERASRKLTAGVSLQEFDVGRAPRLDFLSTCTARPQGQQPAL